jgi:hypothetical protein
MTYSLGFHMGYVRNKVTKFQGEVPSINGVYKLQEGKPINQLYVMSVDRIVRDQSDLDYVQSLVDKIRTISPLIKDRNWATSCMQMRIMTGIWMPTTGSRSATATPPHLLSAVISVFPGKDSISVCCSKG